MDTNSMISGLVATIVRQALTIEELERRLEAVTPKEEVSQNGLQPQPQPVVAPHSNREPGEAEMTK
jgi:hypothetical protein